MLFTNEMVLSLGSYKMRYDSSVMEKKEIIYCHLEGEGNANEAVALVIHMSTKAAGLGYNVLYDAREMKIPSSIMPAYEFATKLSSKAVGSAPRRVKAAFLHCPGPSDSHWRFLETVCVNRGVQLMEFTVEHDALEWLSKK